MGFSPVVLVGGDGSGIWQRWWGGRGAEGGLRGSGEGRGGGFLHGAWPNPPRSALAPGRAARRPCGSASRWCPWPPCGSPACCGSTCPGNGSTSSTPSPSRGPSPTTPSSAPTEVRAPVSHGGAGGRGGGRGPSPQLLLPVPFSAGIPPNKYHYIDDLVVILPQNVWEHLYNRCGPRRPGWSPPGQAFSGAGEGLPPCPRAALTRQQKGREAVAETPDRKSVV